MKHWVIMWQYNHLNIVKLFLKIEKENGSEMKGKLTESCNLDVFRKWDLKKNTTISIKKNKLTIKKLTSSKNSSNTFVKWQ